MRWPAPGLIGFRPLVSVRRLLDSFSRVLLFIHDAKRKIRIFCVSWRSAMNFVRESVFAGPMRNSGKCLAQRFCNDELRWRNAGTNGSQPGSERVPNELGSNDGEILEESLG